jgi:hypothetical protein
MSQQEILNTILQEYNIINVQYIYTNKYYINGGFIFYKTTINIPSLKILVSGSSLKKQNAFNIAITNLITFLKKNNK